MKEQETSLSADDLAMIAVVFSLLGDLFALMALMKEREEKKK